jgi:hypothetical protein
MAARLMTLVRRLFSHDAQVDTAKAEENNKHVPSAAEQDKLDKQRADWEGMTPSSK